MPMIKYGDVPISEEKQPVVAVKLIECGNCHESIPDVYKKCPKCGHVVKVSED